MGAVRRGQSSAASGSSIDLSTPPLLFDWSVEPDRIEVCTDADGKAVLLGAGAFGTVCKSWQQKAFALLNLRQLFVAKKLFDLGYLSLPED